MRLKNIENRIYTLSAKTTTIPWHLDWHPSLIYREETGDRLSGAA